MGLLDNLYIGQNANFGGQQGGLLDFLRTAQMQNDQYQPSAGFSPAQPQQAGPIAIGGYQMPRTGDAAQFTPPPADPAALPPNAQPTQGMMPQQAPGFGPQNEGPITTGLRAFGNQGGLINKVADAVQGFSTGQSPTQRQQTQLFEAYKGAGLSPQQAMVAVLNPQLAQSMIGGGQTDDIKEYHFAKKEDPSLTFQKFMQQKKAVSGEYSLTPQYGTDNDGNTILLQTGKSGEAIQTKLPAGVKISSGVDKIDLGTQWGIIDKRNGQMVGTQPKDVAGKEAAEKVGQAKGTAQATLANGADIDAAATIKKIEEFVSSKGFNEVFGQLDQYRPSWTHSDAGTDALARYKQLKGTAFLSAYSMLKGGGAITDIEGQKAGDAMARLDRAQGEDEARAALKDFREAVDAGLQKLKRAAGGGAEPAPTAAPKRIRLNADGTIAQ
jgi:hypothetical protein